MQPTTTSDGLRALIATSPQVSELEAAELAARHYGLVGRAARLSGEKDENFLIATDHGRYLLKVVHASEPREITNLSTEVMRWLSAVDDLPVQQVLAARDGHYELRTTTGGVDRTVRVTTFLEGRLLRSAPTSVQLRMNLGAVLARLGQALTDFRHPAAFHELLWHPVNAVKLRPLLSELTDLPDRALLDACLDRFEGEVSPRLAALRSQIVHHDMSADNIVIADDDLTITGIIDFGDVVHTQLVNDVAVAATSQLADGEDPMGPVLDLVCGYNAVVPLTIDELRVLYDLVRVRTAMRIIISEWRARRFPQNESYILRNTPRAWAHLKRMPASAADEMLERLHATCAST